MIYAIAGLAFLSGGVFGGLLGFGLACRSERIDRTARNEIGARYPWYDERYASKGDARHD